MKPYDTVNDDFSKFIMERAVLGMTGEISYGQIEEKCNKSGAGTCCPEHGDADCNSSKQNRKEEVEIEEGSMKAARKNVGASTCWDGYKAKGTKKKGGKDVPNCVKEEDIEEGAKKGLWDRMHDKRKRGESPAKKGDKDYPKTLNVEELKGGQKKIDANKNGKIDGHDFELLRGRKGKKSMKEMWQLAAEAKAKIEIMPEIDDRDPGNVKKKNEKKVEEESSCGSSKKAKKY